MKRRDLVAAASAALGLAPLVRGLPARAAEGAGAAETTERSKQLDGMSELERLLASEDIKLLKARRDRALDTKDWATYEALHAPDHYSHNEGEARRDGGKANADWVAKTLADKITVHHSHTPEITFDSPSKANGIWAMEDNIYWKQGEEEHWLHGFGFYHETYEKRDGRWLFTSRQLKRTHVRTSPGAVTSSQQ